MKLELPGSLSANYSPDTRSDKAPLDPLGARCVTHLTLCARRSRATTACGAAVPAGEVKRRADVVVIFPNEDSITRLIGAVLLEQNDEWPLQCRYMQIEGMAGFQRSILRGLPYPSETAGPGRGPIMPDRSPG